jgi:hypothetical protein
MRTLLRGPEDGSPRDLSAFVVDSDASSLQFFFDLCLFDEVQWEPQTEALLEGGQPGRVKPHTPVVVDRPHCVGQPVRVLLERVLFHAV